MNTNNLKHSELTEMILRSFYDVYNELGYGFLEKVYENALAIELEGKGLKVEKQRKINVYFKGQNVGAYYTDIIVENRVILELKATVAIDDSHETQLVNYLKASKIEVGLLLNFGKKPKFKRKIFMKSIFSELDLNK